MHRSRLRSKLVEGRTKMTNKVSERARSMVPIEVGDTNKCIACGRKVRSRRVNAKGGRVCSPACAQKWAGELD